MEHRILLTGTPLQNSLGIIFIKKKKKKKLLQK